MPLRFSVLYAAALVFPPGETKLKMNGSSLPASAKPWLSYRRDRKKHRTKISLSDVDLSSVEDVLPTASAPVHKDSMPYYLNNSNGSKKCQYGSKCKRGAVCHFLHDGEMPQDAKVHVWNVSSRVTSQEVWDHARRYGCVIWFKEKPVDGEFKTFYVHFSKRHCADEFFKFISLTPLRGTVCKAEVLECKTYQCNECEPSKQTPFPRVEKVSPLQSGSQAPTPKTPPVSMLDWNVVGRNRKPSVAPIAASNAVIAASTPNPAWPSLTKPRSLSITETTETTSNNDGNCLAPIPNLTFPANVSFPKGVIAPVVMERNAFATVDKDKTAEPDSAVLKESNLVSSRLPRKPRKLMVVGEDEFFAFVRANTDEKSGSNDLDAAKTYARVVNSACVTPVVSPDSVVAATFDIPHLEQRKDDKAADSDAESDDAESDEGEGAESDVEDEHEHLPESDLVFARSYVAVSKMYRGLGGANAMPIRV